MARKDRDYSNLKETERVWEAVKVQKTEFKDYSLKHMCTTMWRLGTQQIRGRLVHINIGREKFIGKGTILCDMINEMVEQSDENEWLPRALYTLRGHEGVLLIDTREVNEECLKDHVAKVTVGKNTAIIDLEELMKATRYA